VPNDRQAIIAGGLPGAGKTTILEAYAGIERARYFTIDPDQIKEEMAQRDLIPKVDGLSPMEASDLVHAESSHIARRLAHRAKADGKNLIWDISMKSAGGTERRIDDLRSAGYAHIEGIFVEIPVDTSISRADARHKSGQEEYHEGKGYGGRYMPSELIGKQADAEWGSLNRKNFEMIKGRFDRWSIFDNSVDGRAPELVDSSDVDRRSP
jgi:predicted ABC-type ATPase